MVGAVAAIYGCWLAWPPVGFVLGGAMVIALGLLMDSQRK